MTTHSLIIIGGGLAGCEAAWQAAERGIAVTLYERRSGERLSEAHRTDRLAELVCSNSFRSDDDATNAVGLLHWELRQAGSLILSAADACRVPAGSALAVDREAFATHVEAAVAAHPRITIRRDEITDPLMFGDAQVIIATGPLTSSPLASAIRNLTGAEQLAFFDAIAPIVYRESVDFSKAWFQSRYDKGDGKDYINCPLDRETYAQFLAALAAAEKTTFKEWEKDTPYFEGCLPIEVMAERGPETLRYGPMKPVGLTSPHTPERPYAVVQLRQDNALGTLYNMVGFQTKLKYSAQTEVFSLIPGLENAEFARLGGIHRNTFLNSPRLLDQHLRLKTHPQLRFAGQITGVEGYVESTAMGLLAGWFATAELRGETFALPPATTSMGALLRHITGAANAETFQPMNANFGLFPEITGRIKGRERKALYATRGKADFAAWHENHDRVFLSA